MGSQQAYQDEMERNYEESYCQPDCNQYQNYRNDATFDDGYRVCEQSSSQFEQIITDEHEPKCCPCPKKCRMPMCSPFLRRKYIQPHRQPSCKPIACFKKPTLPFASETIYKKSFECIDPHTAACCRLPMIRPRNFLKSPDCPFQKETVMQVIIN